MNYNFWTVPDKAPAKCDCFVVLSYAVKNSHEPNLLTKKLIEKVKLSRRKFPKSYCIMSTGDNQRLGKTNARIMAQYGRKIGIPGKYIIEEGRSRNTYENLQYSWDIIRQKGFKNPTVVTHDLHTRRALAIAKTWKPKNLSWLSVYTKGDSSFGYKRFQTYSRTTILVYEILAYLYCITKGQIKIFV